ncbi:MAG: effector-associated constant component EACC1 [Gemmatimonadaceae bacterium]
MSESLQLSVRSDGASQAELAEITRDLNQWIALNAPQVRANLPPAAKPGKGDKGAAVDIGTIVLAFINAGAATALVTCLSSYITQRRRTVKVDVKNAAGKTLSFNAENLGATEIKELVNQLNSFAATPPERAN